MIDSVIGAVGTPTGSEVARVAAMANTKPNARVFIGGIDVKRSELLRPDIEVHVHGDGPMHVHQRMPGGELSVEINYKPGVALPPEPTEDP